MKKRLCALLILCVLFCLLGSVAASAESTGLGYVTDQAGILTEEQKQSLEDRARTLSERYGVSLYVVTLRDYREYNSYSVVKCAEELYTYYDLGSGPDRDGMLLLLSMSERDYSLTSYGYYADFCFGDPNKDLVESAFLDDFRNNDWMGGFEDYLKQSEDVLATAEAHQLTKDSEYCKYKGQAYPDKTYVYGDLKKNAESAGMPTGLKLLIGIGVPCLIALIVCSSFKAQMKTAKLRTTAEEYVVPNSAVLRTQEDRFLHRTESRVPIQTQSSSGRGGGGSSGGFHSHSGKF